MEPLHALIVDDSPTIRRYIRRILEISKPGCVISEASNGWEALAILEHSKMELIVLDLVMPGMHGDEFLERARGLIRERRCAVIVLSSMSTRELRHRLVEEDLVAFAQKPVLMDEVAEQVNFLLAKAQGVPPPPQAGEGFWIPPQH